MQREIYLKLWDLLTWYIRNGWWQRSKGVDFRVVNNFIIVIKLENLYIYISTVMQF